MLNTYTLENNGAGVITHEFLHSLGYPDVFFAYSYTHLHQAHILYIHGI